MKNCNGFYSLKSTSYSLHREFNRQLLKISLFFFIKQFFLNLRITTHTKLYMNMHTNGQSTIDFPRDVYTLCIHIYTYILFEICLSYSVRQESGLLKPSMWLFVRNAIHFFLFLFSNYFQSLYKSCNIARCVYILGHLAHFERTQKNYFNYF